MLQLVQMMQEPDNFDHQDPEVSNMYKNDHRMFEFTAKQWAENYAKNYDTEEKVFKL